MNLAGPSSHVYGIGRKEEIKRARGRYGSGRVILQFPGLISINSFLTIIAPCLKIQAKPFTCMFQVNLKGISD